MNSEPEPTPAPGPVAKDTPGGTPPTRPPSWGEAVNGMVSSRIGLLRLEAADLARVSVRKIVFALAAAVSALFTWALVVSGAIGLIVRFTSWPWSYVVLGAAAVHLLAALAFVQALRGPAPPAFPLTREEFKKDRAWLETLQKKKSNG